MVVNDDCELSRNLKHTSKVTFSVKNPDANFFADNIKCLPDGVEYEFRGQRFKLQLFGAFNVSNALAAIAVCHEAGINPFTAAKTLEGFSGIKRRLEIVGTNKHGITLIDDFAHNPSKIASSLAALKEYPRRLIVMYQSHSPFSAFNTGREVAAEVAHVLDDNDIFIMPEVYMLDKQKDKDITAANIINEAKKDGLKNAYFFENRENIRNFILQNAKDGDCIVIMGARDNSLPDFSRELLAEL